MEHKMVAIHQPNFLPWIGYFYKIAKSDIFVFLDNVQYVKNSFVNRNKVKTPQDAIWLTVPVSFKFGELINEVKINNQIPWREKHLKTFEMNYKRADFFEDVFEIIKGIYCSRDWQNLSDLNMSLTEAIARYLGLNTSFVRSSTLGVQAKSTELLIQIVKKVGGDIYLSGFGGVKYQEETEFAKAGIKLMYTDFNHPVYKQLWGDFIPDLSIVDLMFNMGSKAFELIKDSWQ
jgi:hypothetical protein